MPWGWILLGFVIFLWFVFFGIYCALLGDKWDREDEEAGGILGKMAAHRKDRRAR